MNDFDDKKDNEPSVDSNKLVKGFYLWFGVGVFVSLMISVSLGYHSQTSKLVRDFAFVYILVVSAIRLIILSVKELKYRDSIDKGVLPILSEMVDKSAAVVIGYGVGYLVLILVTHF